MRAVGARVGLLALGVLTAALVNGWPRVVPFPLLALGGIYASQLAVDDAPLDTALPAFAAGLYVTAELAYWSLEERERVQSEAGDIPRRVAFVAGIGLAVLLVTAALLVLVDSARARGLTVDLVGAIGAAGVLLAVVLLARGRTRH